MPLKPMSAYRRDDYTYESPDGDEYEITIVQTAERKYVEIKRDSEDGDDQVNWDVEMLLDIADAVRKVVHKPAVVKSHSLPASKVIDYRDETPQKPSDAIQESVDKSLEHMEETDAVVPVQSFSPNAQQEIEDRLGRSPTAAPPELQIRRKEH